MALGHPCSRSLSFGTLTITYWEDKWTDQLIRACTTFRSLTSSWLIGCWSELKHFLNNSYCFNSTQFKCSSVLRYPKTSTSDHPPHLFINERAAKKKSFLLIETSSSSWLGFTSNRPSRNQYGRFLFSDLSPWRGSGFEWVVSFVWLDLLASSLRTKDLPLWG